jgi:hypothetical protein
VEFFHNIPQYHTKHQQTSPYKPPHLSSRYSRTPSRPPPLHTSATTKWKPSMPLPTYSNNTPTNQIHQLRGCPVHQLQGCPLPHHADPHASGNHF